MDLKKTRPECRPGATDEMPRIGISGQIYLNVLSQPGKPLPPFGNVLDGEHIIVICGADAWEVLYEPIFARRSILLLPPGRSPFKYRWPVAGRECSIVDRGATAETLLQLEGALWQYGAKRVSHHRRVVVQ